MNWNTVRPEFLAEATKLIAIVCAVGAVVLTAMIR